MQKFRLFLRSVVSSALVLSAHLSAASFSGTVISFNEPAFPTVATDVSGKIGYNVINDSTGFKIASVGELSSSTGDRSDLFLDFTNAATPVGSATWQWQPASSGRFTATHALGDTGIENNPGDLISSTITITFGNHLTIDDLSFTGSSFNTSGIAWEYAIVEFFKPDGSSFSEAPEISRFLDHMSYNGSPSTGWFVIDSTQTVMDVGTGKTANSGVSGTYDMLTSGLGYDDAGLAVGTQIGGVRITTYLEDVRGTSNGNTTFTSSISSINLSGTIVPEPATGTLTGLAGIFLWIRKRKPCYTKRS